MWFKRYRGRHSAAQTTFNASAAVATATVLSVGAATQPAPVQLPEQDTDTMPIVKVSAAPPAVTAAFPPVIAQVRETKVAFKAEPKAEPKPRFHPIVKRSEAQAPPAPTRGAASGVVAIAMQYLGVPYVYGGESPVSGWDCSGFTQYVYAKVGIKLPRVAADQQRASRLVSNPQPGDLVFFGSPAYHVGIYIGNGQMIDAPRTGKPTAVRDIWSDAAEFRRP